MRDVIPVFPVNAVLLPGMALPLHIFEPRYRQLLVDVQSGPGSGAFGIVALHKGTILGWPGSGQAEPEFADVGTLAEILDVTHYDDGASDVLTVGSRRFRIREVLTTETPYLRAQVDWIDEADGDLHPAYATVTRRLCVEYFTLLAQLTGREVDDGLPTDANLLSYHIAAQLPLSLPDRQDLLAQPDAAARLRRAIALLRREIRLLQNTRSISVVSDVLHLIPHPN
ncbi:MAG: LON peptidase substrate-binding domain-containing protein [Actinomycetota bacterium]|nr:LON peptidase substrate-binding domain-containing protein [Actinomycetota bacterium]